MGLHHKVEVPTMIATKPIVKHLAPAPIDRGRRRSTPSTRTAPTASTRRPILMETTIGATGRSRRRGPQTPDADRPRPAAAPGPGQKVVRRGGALPLGAITVDVRKGGRAVTRVVPEREIVLAAFRTSPIRSEVVRADVLRGAAEHVLGDVVRGPVAAPADIVTD